MKIRKRIWEIAEATKPKDWASRIFVIFILTLIFLNVIAVIVGSIKSVQDRFESLLYGFELFSVLVFTIEYILRLWSCTMDPRFSHPISGRIRFMFHAMTIIDLLAILPFYLPFLGVDMRVLRILRLLRILRIAKVGRYYSSLTLIKQVFQSKKEELILSSTMMALLIVVSSSVLYYCENDAQPETFSSIPATMWWAVATLTTVGYGDLYPVTLLGKFFASIIAILGIGMFALPTGILGAGFVEAVQKSKAPRTTCPHCGKELNE